MGEEIKSTWEIVQEKLQKIGKADPEELKLEKIKEEALRNCAKFLNDPSATWEDTVANYLAGIETKYRKQAIKALTETLLKNVVLPKMESQLANSKRALEGLNKLFRDIPEMKKLVKQTEALLSEHYAQRKALFEELKKRFTHQISALEKALSNNLGVEVKVAPEQHPQFQEEWQKVSEYLDREGEKQLEYLKHVFLKVAS